jgi:hypothetical protein
VSEDRLPHPARLTATCVWAATPELIVALDDRFGEPHDAYVNGSQVWLLDNGPADATLEWRLHPVAGYHRPAKVGTYELFDAMSLALSTGATPPAPLERVWDGLECFAAYEDPIEPHPLAGAASAALGLAPDAIGLVDHQSIAERWERSERQTSIIGELLSQLQTPAG